MKLTAIDYLDDSLLSVKEISIRIGLEQKEVERYLSRQGYWVTTQLGNKVITTKGKRYGVWTPDETLWRKELVSNIQLLRLGDKVRLASKEMK